MGERVMEEWRDVKGCEGIYKVSNLGRVKSLERQVYLMTGQPHYKQRELILRQTLGSNGYNYVSIYEGRKKRVTPVQYLVWDAFGRGERDGHRLLLDHIDGDKLNNRIDNLQLLTNRENINKYHSQHRDLPSGVDYRRKTKNYRASIYIDGKKKHIGQFSTPEMASQAYQREARRPAC